MRFTYDPTLFHFYFNDFNAYAAGDWTITTTEAGAGSATEALTAGRGGLLLITNDAADDDADFFQLPTETFKYVAGKRLHFSIRFAVSDVVQSDIVAGLQITDTTPLAVTDGIFFRKNDADSIIDLVVCKNSTETVAEVATLVNATQVRLDFVYDGSEEAIKAYVDGVGACSVALTNVPDDEELTVSFGLQNGEAVAKTMTIDYVMAAEER